MKNLILLLVLTFSIPSFAGPGGGHSHKHSDKIILIKKEKTFALGRKQIKRLVKAGKLEISWETAEFKKSEKKNFKGQEEWVVVFKNKKSTQGETLYIFLTLSGKFVAANFTGK